jgi:ornithine cyclodeaminase
VTGADAVLTCTASRTALVRAEWLKLGVHVTSVGSDGPDKHELDPAIPGRADLFVVDSRVQSAAIGELHHALAAGLATSSTAVELGEICADVKPGRTSPDQITVCDLTGLGALDVAAVNLVLQHAGDRGERIPL